jgi:hypothetical protein
MYLSARILERIDRISHVPLARLARTRRAF